MNFSKARVTQFWDIVYAYVPQNVSKSKVSWTMLTKALPTHSIGTLHKIRKEFYASLHDSLTELCAPFCEYNDAGSVSPTSDMDISMLYVRPVPALEIAKKYTEQVWGKDIRYNRLFDINLYAHIWYMPCKTRIRLIEECAYKDIPSEIMLRQIGWSMQRLLESEPDIAAKSQYAGVASKVKAYRKKQNVTLSAAIERMQTALLALPQNKLAEYFDMTSTVASLSEEAFYSCGAYLHVVVRMQKKTRIKLARELYVMSFFDNLGFLVHADGDGHVAKYAYRCLDALKHMGYMSAQLLSTHEVLRTFYAAKLKGDNIEKERMLNRFIELFGGSSTVRDAVVAWLCTWVSRV